MNTTWRPGGQDPELDLGMQPATISVEPDFELGAVALRFDLPELNGEFLLGIPNALDLAMGLIGACMRLRRAEWGYDQ
jgi:hypothetical protein